MSRCLCSKQSLFQVPILPNVFPRLLLHQFICSTTFLNAPFYTIFGLPYNRLRYSRVGACIILLLITPLLRPPSVILAKFIHFFSSKSEPFLKNEVRPNLSWSILPISCNIFFFNLPSFLTAEQYNWSSLVLESASLSNCKY